MLLECLCSVVRITNQDSHQNHSSPGGARIFIVPCKKARGFGSTTSHGHPCDKLQALAYHTVIDRKRGKLPHQDPRPLLSVIGDGILQYLW